MPIDPSLALNVRPAEIPDPLQQYGRTVQLKSLLGQQELHGLQMQQARRELDQSAALDTAYRGALGPDGKLNEGTLLATLAERGLGSKIPGVQKQLADARNAQLDTAEKQGKIRLQDWNMATSKAAELNKVLASLTANPNVTHDDVRSGIVGLVNRGLMSADEGAEAYRQVPGDPRGLRSWLEQRRNEMIEPAKLIELRAPKLQEQSDGQRKWYVDVNPNSPTFGQRAGPGEVQLQASPEAVMADQRARSEGAANRAVTVRGQNLIDARARETAESGSWQTDWQTGLQVNSRTGATRPVQALDGSGPLGPRPKDLTDAQGKANLFGTRAQEADRIIAQVSQQPGGFFKGATDRPGFIKRTAEGVAGAVPLVGEKLADGVGAALNWTQSDAQQQIEQAQRDFINAILRRESGAVISDSEFANARKQYFPEVGDSTARLEQKARNRALAVQGILAEVPQERRATPPARGGAPAPAPAPAAPGGPKPGVVEDGYVFLGGDPANPASWKKAGGGR